MQTPYYGIVYCMAEEDEILDASTLAKVGNQCMQLKGINACFVIGKTGDNEVRISARSDGTVNVQVICEKLDGGGHLSQAAALLKKTTINEVKDKLLDVLSAYLSDARTSIRKGE
jgi:cyclic-di-AMP phosphodiesterase